MRVCMQWAKYIFLRVGFLKVFFSYLKLDILKLGVLAFYYLPQCRVIKQSVCVFITQLLWFSVPSESKTKNVTMAEHVYTRIEMGLGSGTLLFGRISYQQPTESGAVRGNVRAHTEKRCCHWNCAARPSAGYTQEIVTRHGEHLVDSTSVRRFREILVDGRRKVSEIETYDLKCYYKSFRSRAKFFF